ncbi:MAG: hypothetical protein FD130_2291, partial [Halothiobacillaceae bacterium]
MLSLTQPTGQTCVVNSGSGTITGNVTSVAVVCTHTTVVIDDPVNWSQLRANATGTVRYVASK